MMCSNSDWTAIVPTYPHVGKFDFPELDFEILDGLVIYNSYQVEAFT